MKKTDMERMAVSFADKAVYRGWSRDWKHVGVYLHLEASEFIEALRGKGGNPVNEVADVMFVLMSSFREHGIEMRDVMDRLNEMKREIDDLEKPGGGLSDVQKVAHVLSIVAYFLVLGIAIEQTVR